MWGSEAKRHYKIHNIGERYTYRLKRLMKGRAGRRRKGQREEKDRDRGSVEWGREVETASPHLCLYAVEVRLQTKKLMELLKKGIWNLPLGPLCQGIMVRSLAFEFQPAIYSADTKRSLGFMIYKIQVILQNCYISSCLFSSFSYKNCSVNNKMLSRNVF